VFLETRLTLRVNIYIHCQAQKNVVKLFVCVLVENVNPVNQFPCIRLFSNDGHLFIFMLVNNTFILTAASPKSIRTDECVKSY